jgi:ribonuclease HI
MRDLGLTIFIDGASRGNPGPAGIGVAVFDPKGESLAEESAYIGRATNNVAEYRALIQALETAIEMRASRVIIMTDSELLYRQMRGLYRVRDAKLVSLFRQAVSLAKEFQEFQLRRIPRGENKKADSLANYALDQSLSREMNPGEGEVYS